MPATRRRTMKSSQRGAVAEKQPKVDTIDQKDEEMTINKIDKKDEVVMTTKDQKDTGDKIDDRVEMDQDEKEQDQKNQDPAVQNHNDQNYEVNLDENDDDGDDDGADNDDTANLKNVELKNYQTIDEKIAILDSLSKAHPPSLLHNLANLSNIVRPRVYSKVVKTLDPENKEDKAENHMSATITYKDVKMSISKIPGSNLKFASKVAYDLMLAELYGEGHELYEETEAVKELEGQEISVEADPEGYATRQGKYEKLKEKKINKMIKKIENDDKLDDETKAGKIERYQSFKKAKDELLDYDIIYKTFDDVYYRVMHNCVKNRRNSNLGYETKISKITENGEETDIDVKGRQNEKADDTANDPSENEAQTASYKVKITVTKNEQQLFELEEIQRDSTLKGARSEAAYKVVEYLLKNEIIDRISRNDLGRTEKLRRQQNRNQRRGTRGKPVKRKAASTNPEGKTGQGDKVSKNQKTKDTHPPKKSKLELLQSKQIASMQQQMQFMQQQMTMYGFGNQNQHQATQQMVPMMPMMHYNAGQNGQMMMVQPPVMPQTQPQAAARKYYRNRN